MVLVGQDDGSDRFVQREFLHAGFVQPDGVNEDKAGIGHDGGAEKFSANVLIIGMPGPNAGRDVLESLGDDHSSTLRRSPYAYNTEHSLAPRGVRSDQRPSRKEAVTALNPSVNRCG